MNSNTIQIMQQQATVDLLESLVRNKRASINELEQAKRRLQELQQLAGEPGRQLPEYSVSDQKISNSGGKNSKLDEKSHAASGNANGNVLLSRDLMSQIDKCSRRLAEVCNSMGDVPKSQPCPDIMKRALEIKREHEDLWTKYRYLQANGRLPQDQKEEEKLSEERSIELLAALADRQKASEKRSKLKKKIADPSNIRNKLLDQWKMDLVQVEADYEYYDGIIKILKNK